MRFAERLAVIVLLSPMAANAELIDLGETTVDTATGLEWLDLTLTSGMSILDTEASPYMTSGEFRWATDDEIVSLMAYVAPGLANGDRARGNDLQKWLLTQELILFLGFTRQELSFLYTAGVSRESPDPDGDPTAYSLGNLHISDGFWYSVNTPATHCCWFEDSRNDRVGSWLVRAKSAPEPIAIDIKPGDEPNCFNANGHGVIPVAVLGSDTFDVSSIDQPTLSFGGATVRVRGNKGPFCGVEDANNDGFNDIVCQFEDNPEYWEPGQDDATLTGALLDGTSIEGTDTICIVP